jgi:hypothetical protein
MSHKKPHPIRNKLHHAVRQGVMFLPKQIFNKKREEKKYPVHDEHTR